MVTTSPERNKALVLNAFDTLFNKRDYAAEGFSGFPTDFPHLPDAQGDDT